MGNNERRGRRPASEFLANLQDMVEDLFDDGDDEGKERYINDHMKRAGYKPRISWDDADDGDDSDSGFDPLGSRRRERREIRGSGSRGRSSGGFGSSQYG